MALPLHPAAALHAALRLAGAILLSVLLFSLLPFAQRLFGDSSSRNVSGHASQPVLFEVKKEQQDQRQRRPLRLRSIQSGDRRRSTGKDLSAMRFSPDLAVGGTAETGLAQDDLASAIFEEGETDEPAVPLSRTEVPYPYRAEELGIAGTVEMIILIDRTGRVADVSFVRLPDELFRAPVSRAVRQWRFKPATVRGVPVQVRVRQVIEFERITR